MIKPIYHFAESFYYKNDDPSGKFEAESYLKCWKENLIYKITKDKCVARIVDEYYVIYDEILNNRKKMSFKLAVEIDFQWEVEPFAIEYIKGKISEPTK